MSQGIQEWTVSGGSIRVFNTIEWIFLDDCNYVSHLTKIFFFHLDVYKPLILAPKLSAVKIDTALPRSL